MRLVKKGPIWVYDADVSKYSDTIPHDLLMEKLRSHYPNETCFDQAYYAGSIKTCSLPLNNLFVRMH